jgi:hypothetical protein
MSSQNRQQQQQPTDPTPTELDPTGLRGLDNSGSITSAGNSTWTVTNSPLTPTGINATSGYSTMSAPRHEVTLTKKNTETMLLAARVFLKQQPQIDLIQECNKQLKNSLVAEIVLEFIQDQSFLKSVCNDGNSSVKCICVAVRNITDKPFLALFLTKPGLDPLIKQVIQEQLDK